MILIQFLRESHSYITKAIKYWLSQKLIKGIVAHKDKVINTNLNDQSEWLYPVRNIGKKTHVYPHGQTMDKFMDD